MLLAIAGFGVYWFWCFGVGWDSRLGWVSGVGFMVVSVVFVDCGLRRNCCHIVAYVVDFVFGFLRFCWFGGLVYWFPG